MHVYYYTDCTKEGKHTIRCGMFYAIRLNKTSKHFRIAGKLHDRIEDNYMITVTLVKIASNLLQINYQYS